MKKIFDIVSVVVFLSAVIFIIVSCIFAVWQNIRGLLPGIGISVPLVVMICRGAFLCDEWEAERKREGIKAKEKANEAE